MQSSPNSNHETAEQRRQRLKAEYETSAAQLDQAEYKQHDAQSGSQATSNPNPPMGEGWDHHTPPDRY